MMSGNEVRSRVEAILLGMVMRGEADFLGVGRTGACTFHADPELLLDHIEAAGLLDDGVPWSAVIVAMQMNTA